MDLGCAHRMCCGYSELQGKLVKNAHNKVLYPTLPAESVWCAARASHFRTQTAASGSAGKHGVMSNRESVSC